MTYEHNLAFYLRMRGLPEAQVSEAIDEVRAHVMSSGNSAESEFGTAEDYAESFSAVKRRTLGVRVITVAGVL
ncbi:MAG: hypothetical protein L0J08_08550, partial [Micrococcaceae bacterium]|nr:hypothetical protein [Micrococcaceae bacterium]